MKRKIILTIFILVLSILGIAKDRDGEETKSPKITPIYTTIVEFLLDSMEKPGVGYILRFSDNQQAQEIPYLRFQAFEISKKVDMALIISTKNDFGPVCGFFYRGVRFDVGLSAKLHTITRDLKNIKLSLVMGVSIPLRTQRNHRFR